MRPMSAMRSAAWRVASAWRRNLSGWSSHGPGGLEELIGVDRRGGGADAPGTQHLDRFGNARQPMRAPVGARGGAQDRDREAGVGLDRLRDLVDRDAGLGDEALDAPARLRERRQLLDGGEGVSEAMAASSLRLRAPA